jgi:cobalt-zinc-cadmium efflux system outer membrane protein
MRRRAIRTFRWLAGATLSLSVGCAGLQSPMPDGAYIRNPVAPMPAPTPAPTPSTLPAAPSLDAALKPTPVSTTGVLPLVEVLSTVKQNFPLLQAIQEERSIAMGQRIVTEAAFDLNLRGSVTNNEGSFGNTRLDLVAEQATPYNGLNVFGGYRMGLGDFPVYNLGQKTAQGGELRAGFSVPLLRDGSIDRRRAALRQAQIAEQLADPVIRRSRLDALRAAARAYWAWVAAGQRTIIQQELLKLANARQADLEALRDVGKRIGDIPVNDNKRAIYERRELVLAAERGFQEAALVLSVYLCDANGDPVVPSVDRLPKDFLELNTPELSTATLEADVATAMAARPELDRLRLQKEQLAVEYRLAMNQFLPAVNVGAGVSQDVGYGSKSFTGTGIFGSDRTSANVFLTSDLPVQRRDAQGRAQQARARMVQINLNEKHTQNMIRAEVQDSLSSLIQSHKRLEEARKERAVAVSVANDEQVLVKNALSDVFFLNQRELNAASAKVKIANLLAEYYRAYADYRVALGDDMSSAMSVDP